MKTDCSEQRAPVWPVLLSVLAVNVGSLVAGYSMGYSSSALLDLAELSSEYAFQKGSLANGLFAVSYYHIVSTKLY